MDCDSALLKIDLLVVWRDRKRSLERRIADHWAVPASILPI
jgi:hypothetical protein